ncbi:serine hydrolase [Novosphingobium flavum]|uniref:Beta-lactamase n=1 Tax=Novosphingobium flavum TaxID=1778672 RepID=A0A7X1FRD4_9SPHN|nr:serine hydrolase [Novosphingobium flavum]MBC2665117.1 serine hydrolase [Novosphingobium flavum]
MTGLKARLAALAAFAVAAVMPISANAGELETRFDQLLGSVQRAPRDTSADPFEVQLARLAEASRGRIGVAALDLESGRQVAVLGDQPFPMASTSKIAIVATFLSGVDQGRWSLDSRYPLMMPVPSKKFSTAIAPVRAGAMLTAQQLIEAAITRSDNHATDALLAVVGGPAAVTRWVHANTGITEFRLDHDIATMVRDDGAVNPAVTVDRRDSITPNAMIRMLAGLQQGRWLSPSSRNVLLGAMGRTVTGRHRIKAGLPVGVTLAHKTGTLSNTASDVGFIQTPDGRNLAVAIYVTGQGDHAGRDSRIALLARGIYDGFNQQGPMRTALR